MKKSTIKKIYSVTTGRPAYGCHGVGIERDHRMSNKGWVWNSDVLKPEVLPRRPSISLSIAVRPVLGYFDIRCPETPETV